MAMAGQGLHAAPPPRPPSHNYFGAQSNPGNQLYVGNVRLLPICDMKNPHLHDRPHSYHIKLVGKI